MKGLRILSFVGGTMHKGTLPLGGGMWPSWTYMHWDSFVCLIGSAAPQVEASSDHYSSSLHNLVPVGH